MKAPIAPLRLIVSIVTQNSFYTIGEITQNTDIEYSIDFEVDFLTHKKSEIIKRVSILSNIEPKGNCGYSIKFAMFCDFEIINESEHIDNSTLLALSISEVRAYLRNITSFGVHGVYVLPLIHPSKFINDYKVK